MDKYARYKVAPSTHYAIEHDVRQLDRGGQAVTSPELPGVSGSPLVLVHQYSSQDDLLQVRIPKLVGVVIEHHRQKQDPFILATRLRILLAGIRVYLRGGDSAVFLA